MKALNKTTSLFRLFRQAVRGEEQNFTEGSINRAIFLLSIPMILEMAMESLLAVVDIFFISRLNDNDAVTAVGLWDWVWPPRPWWRGELARKMERARQLLR